MENDPIKIDDNTYIKHDDGMVIMQHQGANGLHEVFIRDPMLLARAIGVYLSRRHEPKGRGEDYAAKQSTGEQMTAEASGK